MDTPPNEPAGPPAGSGDSPVSRHRAEGPASLACAVVTVSDTRTEADDRGGGAILELLASSPHRVAARRIIPDEPTVINDAICALVDQPDIDAVLLTGGTGIAPRDHTIDVVERLLDKRLPGYGELLRMLSYQQVGSAAMLSRATAGVVGQTIILTMPGSPAAVRLAMQELILPELGHLVSQARG
ncbi:Molybdenum cofactor biosynthesis protein B [Posidoniimonas polymericola]|uniref:Molybdenum cofactor biosynthesis protein B n=1 Tax=Posidoniimonas polymericola TaxID=2528002 RepID=A0A5C5ZEH8_9BACT|nr:MogA/MoaB family molybdenum cofactor biosynthesis protein [Posidoniimonas polymericola]TWT85566.1 Molybdenum cofactor biosynthesis protein B [Posidoniimonas polymericola]